MVGSAVEWTITQNVPSLSEGETYDSASIYEVLDPELLEYAATTVLKVTESGDIENPGSEGSTSGCGSEFNGSKIPGGPTPATYWGALEVEKVDQDGNALAGAEFKVTAAPESGVCPRATTASGWRQSRSRPAPS